MHVVYVYVLGRRRASTWQNQRQRENYHLKTTPVLIAMYTTRASTIVLLYFLVLTRSSFAEDLRCWIFPEVFVAADCQAAIDLIPAVRLDVDAMARHELDRLHSNADPRMTLEFPEGARTIAQQAIFHNNNCFIIVRNTDPIVQLSQDSRVMHFWPAVKRRAQNVMNVCVHGHSRSGWEWGTVPSTSANMRYNVRLWKGTDEDLRKYRAIGFDIIPPLPGPAS